MPEWLVERGIGEARAALVEDGEIVEARIELDGAVPAGSIVAAKLVSGGRNAVAIAADGREYLLPKGAPGVTEGASLTIEVTREAIPGAEAWKRPLAKASAAAPAAVPPLTDRLNAREIIFPGARDEFGDAGWEELIDQARTGIVRFAGGELRISPTPAMTLIDVDGSLPPDQLAILGATEAARAIRRLDIGGSIGIDLPTTRSKAARTKAAEAIDDILSQPFERTAVNGFGFVQIVRPRQRASLIEFAQDRADFEARALLRRAARETAGGKRLVAHPAVTAVLQQREDWIERLSQQLGGAIGLRADPALPMSGGYAEKL
ncbi:MAG: ribonuclease [Pseudomonadota bacterium]